MDWNVIVVAFGDDGKTFKDTVAVSAPTGEHAGIKACAGFIEKHPTAYALRVSEVIQTGGWS